CFARSSADLARRQVLSRRARLALPNRTPFNYLTAILPASIRSSSQGEHGVSRCRVSHEAPDVRRWTTSLTYGERRPKALRPVLVTHQPSNSPPQVNIVAG